MKKIIILIITVIMVLSTTQLTYAFDLGSALGGADTFLSGGKTEASSTDVDGAIDDTIKGLVSAGLGIGTIVAICGGIIIAIKNMTDGANGKKELKESLTPYIIGCVVLFGAFTVWSGIVQVMENTFDVAGGPSPSPSPSPSPTPTPAPTPAPTPETNQEEWDNGVEYLLDMGATGPTTEVLSEITYTNVYSSNRELELKPFIEFITDQEGIFYYRPK